MGWTALLNFINAAANAFIIQQAVGSVINYFRNRGKNDALTSPDNTDKLNKDNFDDAAKKEFLNGAKIAYETIITSFSSGNLKDIKSLLGKKVLNEFNDALKERKDQGLTSETTFIGINSADIKNHNE